ncbi:MAG TPA: DNA internalization-related competence protein ComEC/Rec2 [Candidatus Polarisedimenticolaceae bacterium]|nr:DNA internalization-related competence protein ComEC/Rec2 [Candidatus Polarisedimenticolaceae bacterium]
MHPPRRPALAPCLALLAGVALGEAFPCAPRTVWLTVPPLLAAVPALRRRRRCARALLLLAAALVGLGLASAEVRERAARIAPWIPEAGGSWEGNLEGLVLRAAEREADGTRAVLVQASFTLWMRVRVPEGTTPEAVAQVDGLRRGDRIRAWCRLRRPVPLGNPGANDPDLTLRARGIDLTGTVKTPRLVVCLGRGQAGPSRALDEATVRLRSRLDRTLGRGDARGLVGAMLLGERGSLSPDALRALRDSGTFHVLSVSGLHVALLLGACLLPLRPVSLRRGGSLVRLGVAGAVLGGLVALVGAQPPVARAAAAAALALAGRVLGRTGDGLNTLALAAACLVLDRPARLLDPGFQLSFLATAALLVGTRAAAAVLPLPRAAAVSLGASAAAYLATAPALAWHLGRLAPVGLLANLGAAPACAAVMGTGALALLAADVPVAGEAAGRLARACAEASLTGAGAMAVVPWGTLQVARPSVLLLGALVGATWRAWRSARSASRPAWSLAAALGFVALHLGPAPPRAGPAQVEVLDVGQGLSVLVRGPDGGALLIDAGGRGRGSFDAGERVVAPALARLGLRRIQVLVLTHGHDDHAGGIPAVLRQCEVGELWLGPGWTREPLAREAAEVARSRGTALVLVERGFEARRAGCDVRVRHPARPFSATVNDRCVAVLVRARGASLLVPGDVERQGALALADAGDVAADALLVPHHGSRSGTPAAFLEAVGPRIAVVSAGRDNVHGHPHPETARRIRRAGIPLRRTDRDGSVRLVETAAGWLEGGGEEGEEEHDRERHEDHAPDAPHAPPLVRQGRVPVAHQHQDHGPEHVGRGTAGAKRLHRHEGDHRDHRPARQRAMEGAGDGVGRMTTVQLSDREQVQRGHEHAEPPRDPDAVEGERPSPGQAELQQPHQDGPSEGRRGAVGGHAPRHQGDEPDHEPGERARGRDVEQGLAVGDDPAHADDGAERAEGNDPGKEEGERGRDSVVAAGEVVPHLVGPQDRQHGECVGRPRAEDVPADHGHEERAPHGAHALLARHLLEPSPPGDPCREGERPGGGRDQDEMEPETAAGWGDRVQASPSIASVAGDAVCPREDAGCAVWLLRQRLRERNGACYARLTA